MIKRLKDWWRGYSDQDIETARKKMAQPPNPSGLILVSGPELKAIIKEGLTND